MLKIKNYTENFQYHSATFMEYKVSNASLKSNKFKQHSINELYKEKSTSNLLLPRQQPFHPLLVEWHHPLKSKINNVK